MTGSPIVAGRGCGTCSLCCKLLEIGELGKPAGDWCQHVLKGRGCSIYASRPAACAEFTCGYLLWKEAGEHWLPSKARMVIAAQGDDRLAVHVDPATPNVWKTSPYYDDLKRWARNPGRYRFRQIIVAIGRRMIAILPDRDVDLGLVAPDEIVISGPTADGGHAAFKLAPDDPQLPKVLRGGSYVAGRSG